MWILTVSSEGSGARSAEAFGLPFAPANPGIELQCTTHLHVKSNGSISFHVEQIQVAGY